ncbi:MAG: glycoside hydrolase family 3 protein [Lachnospiraceae bacterium]
MNKKNKKTLVRSIIAYFFCAIIVTAVVIGNLNALKYQGLISVYFNQSNQKVISADGESTEYYSSAFSSQEEATTHLQNIARQIEEEGITLLLNNDNALPLELGNKISLFGQDSVDPIYGGSGAGSVDVSKAVNLKSGLENAGFLLNETLYDFYDTGAGASYRKTVPNPYGEGAFAVNEVPVSVYTDEVKESFANYNDAAVVVLGRSGGESSDLATSVLDTGVTYLQLDSNEQEMLQLACDEFDKVIVVLNTQNAMELGFLNDYDVDACIWIGGLGQEGANAVGSVLNGTINPSGAMVDTYAYDSFSSPAMANFGVYNFTNSNVDRGTGYLVYQEGIYIGYHYYETRYEDVVMGNEDVTNYNYSNVVQYPFGFGLSYTNFEWSNYSIDETDESYNITIDIKNVGDTKGKDIVQIYMQSPYTDYDKENSIEKSSVKLVGYAKTSELEPADEETVTISIPKEEMKVYDANGYNSYIVDAGEYYFAAGQNAHDALNNILSTKGYTIEDGMDYPGDPEFVEEVSVEELDSTTYAVSQETGNPITNQFQSVDIKYYDQSVTYLTRNDWTGTWPITYMDGLWAAPEQLLADLEIKTDGNSTSEIPLVGTINAEAGELSTAALIGLDYSDELWGILIEQMTIEELDALVRIGGYATQNIESIQLPATVDKDGPAGISGTLVGGESGTSYPPEIILASTWNDELAEEFGRCIGEDGLSTGVQVWYAPACNLHRSPYSGRNFEYYSEDAFLSGKMSAATVRGAQSMGIVVTLKHFALNDQESNRIGGAIFSNEQALREHYLKAFEIGVREGNALGMMAGMNRIGATWTGGSYALITSTLREEWGFQGMVVTDQASYSVFAYEDLREGLAAGTDLWLNTDSTLWVLSDDQITDGVIASLQRASKNIVYAISNSSAMNGIAVDGKVVSVIPLWQKLMYGADILIGLLVLITLVLITKNLSRKMKFDE